jgi:Ran GTPase-activating protein 1
MAIFTLKGLALKLDTPADLEPHINPLLTPNSITEIHLEGNTIGVPAAQHLSTLLLTQSRTLQIANLADLFTGRLLSEIPLALDALLTALLECKNLHTVNLNDNAFGLNTVEPLRPFLSKCISLRHLYLNNNGLGPAAGALVAEALVELAGNKAAARREKGEDSSEVPELETVICGRNRLETGSMAAWVEAYKANSHVKVVKMVQNGIRQEGMAMLLKNGLSLCQGLEVLDMQDNTFTSLAARTLAGVVGEWKGIRELAVGDCLLSARGGRMLGEALAKGENVKLEVLRLQFNEIDGKGLRAIADAARSGSALPRLRRVELNGNKFAEEDESIEVLERVLAERNVGHAEEFEGVDGDDEEAWGIDELDELEEDDDDDGEEGEDDEVEDAEEEKIVKEADEVESEPVAAEKDSEVDDLAERMGKTMEIK